MARRELTPEEQAKLQEMLNKRDEAKNTQQSKAAKNEGHWCPNCGNYFLDFSESVCQICGFESLQKKGLKEFSLPENNELTMCRIETLQFSGRFAFAQLKIDMTPEHLINVLSYRIFKEPNPDEFYVFKRAFNGHMSVGNQIDLDLTKYNIFRSNNDVKVHYNNEHFTEEDITEIKSQYNFDVF